MLLKMNVSYNQVSIKIKDRKGEAKIRIIFLLHKYRRTLRMKKHS